MQDRIEKRVELEAPIFSALPDDPLCIDALRRNTEGWNEQAKSIAAHVES